MNKILLLGGISEAKQLAHSLWLNKIAFTYSIQGNVRIPEEPYDVHTGGFAQYAPPDSVENPGIAGLVHYIRNNHITMIADCTHPYAKDISHNAKTVANLTDITYRQYYRPSWDVEALPRSTQELAALQIQEFNTIESIVDAVQPYSHTFWAMGLKSLPALVEEKLTRQNKQQWTIRTAAKGKSDTLLEKTASIQSLQQIGPFSFDHEVALFTKLGVDALVCKNSGSPANESKLHAAAILGIPVLLLKRPDKPAGIHTFSSIESLLGEIMTCTETQLITKAHT
ncbi:hypothetical protein A9Q99_24255 [Gammaproteobacteria bacterium 45_16_T64]|nr:hypothetical protein A9Q99_24255 [Gammaproteobacteria bacterium 45_16_T64]